MNDETIEIPAPLQEAFSTAVKEAYREHEKELRRSREISTGFYEKLLALDAGSLAVAASIGVALAAKPDSQFGSRNVFNQWLVVITVFLWVSLICAVSHNFVAVYIAKLESAYSEAELVRVIIRRAVAIVRNIGSPEAKLLDQIEKGAQEQPLTQQQRNVRWRQILHPSATVLGYISIGSFLIAYTLVMIRVVRLWCVT
jgi:hypothetical protein